MKGYFKPSSLLFYLLAILVFFFLGMVFAAITDAGKGQGLAGGAIVFGYGVISAGIAFLASIFLVSTLSSSRVVRLNKIFLVLFAVMLLFFIYRYQTTGTLFKRSSFQSPNTFLQTAEAASLEVDHTRHILPMGLGMVQPNFNNNSELFFYSRPNLEKAVTDHLPVESLVFSQSETGISIKSAPPWFVPAHLKMDYGVLYLRLISVSPEFIEVVVNKLNGQTAYLDRSKNKLLYWPDFLLSINSVEPISEKANPVRVKPLNHAGLVIKKYAFLKPLKIRREWIYVELRDDNFNSLGKGWIKWHEKAELLIRYSLFS